MVTIQPGMSMTLALNEWTAIAEALGHTAESYRPDMHGVDLHALRDIIERGLYATHVRNGSES